MGADPHAAGHAVRRMASGGHARVVVSGEADCAVAAEIGEALAHAVAEHPRRLTVDLRGVTFVDSSFLKVLLGGKAAADAAAVPMVLELSRGGAVERLFTLTGLTGHFPTTARAAETA